MELQPDLTTTGVYQPAIAAALETLAVNQIIPRIWQHDHTVWRPDPHEITNRLGWLHCPETMPAALPHLTATAEAVRAAGYTQALLLGMGGSSLAPEVLRHILGVTPGYLDLAVLDSTTPAAVLTWATRLDPDRTLFIVSTKSGGTVETFSFFKFFYRWTVERLDPAQAGEHFIAITDPGSGLATTAARYGFRTTFLNDPNIGGRYSALSYFGLVPAALMGHDLEQLLASAAAMAQACGPHVPPSQNPAARLGAALGTLALAGRDKVTFVLSPMLASFGDWVEQLIAESTGKEGRGLVPVVGEPLGPAELYGADRLFVFIRLATEPWPETAMTTLQEAGHPLLTFTLPDRYALGGQFFLWELATAIASHQLGIQPFDQPNVEAAKVLARQMMTAYLQQGTLPPLASAPLQPIALLEFLAPAQAGDYIALQAYLPPTPETTAALQRLRTALRNRYRLATTVGYGPRFLHSTGQLHKGDAGRGFFIQFTADDPQDAPIPDEADADTAALTFGILKTAQARGDYQALLNAGRRVIHFHLGHNVVQELTALHNAITV